MWDERDDEVIEDIEPPPSNIQILHSDGEDYKIKTILKWIMIFISRLRTLYSISDAASNFVLKFLLTLLDCWAIYFLFLLR